MAEYECPGGCNRAYRDACAIYDDALAKHADRIAELPPGAEAPEPPEPPRIRPWLGDPWCRRCKAGIRQQLSVLDKAAALVAEYADGHRQAADPVGRVSGSPAERSPSPAVDALDELASVLRSWEAFARGGEPPGRSGYLAKEITETAAWLGWNFDQIITGSEGTGFGQAISWWYRHLTGWGKSGDARERKPMPCPACKRQSLCHEPGGPYIECIRKTECGRLLSHDEYEELEANWRAAKQAITAV